MAASSCPAGSQTRGAHNTSRPTGGPKLGLTPPRLRGGWPLVGHAPHFIRDAIGLLHTAYRECGEVAQFQVAHRQFVLLSGPDAAEALFRAPDTIMDPQEPYKMMEGVFGKDIAYAAPHEKFMEQLRMLLPALQDKRMRTYGEIIADEVRQSLDAWGDEGELDVLEWTKVLTNFTSSHCLLGPEFRHEMTTEFADVYADLERSIVPLVYVNHKLPLPVFRRRDKARKRLVEMIADIVASRRRSGRKGEDFLQTLMDANYKSGDALSDHEITGMLLAAMFAGHHTSSVTTAWTLLELVRHPAYLQRVCSELDAMYGDSEDISYQSLREIPCTENAIKEALRLYPPLFMLLRAVKQDWTFKGYLLPKGTWVITSPHVSHRISSVFHNPEVFDPDRFAKGREEDRKAGKFSFISFGAGRHRCMGNAFALLQVKTIFAILLRRYEFELVGDPHEADFHGVVVGPRQPCRIRYRRRASV